MIFSKKYRKRFKFISNAHNRRQATMPGGGLLALVSYGSQNVILNGNHPLAGETLHFDVTIKEIREATKEEKEHGHVHGPGGHHHH